MSISFTPYLPKPCLDLERVPSPVCAVQCENVLLASRVGSGQGGRDRGVVAKVGVRARGSVRWHVGRASHRCVMLYSRLNNNKRLDYCLISNGRGGAIERMTLMAKKQEKAPHTL